MPQWGTNLPTWTDRALPAHASAPADRGDRVMGTMRIDWPAFLIVFLVLTIVALGALVGLYVAFTRLIAFLEKRDK